MPSPDRVQVGGRPTRLPSILPVETPQRAQLHLTASTTDLDVPRSAKEVMF
jgi:hypothetical protein